MKFTIITALLFLCVVGCDTQRKAVKQATKAMASKHSLAAAEVVRKIYPCVPSAPDSAKFLKSIAELKILLNAADAEKAEIKTTVQTRVKRVKDSLEQYYSPSLEQLEGCRETTQELFDYASTLQVTVENLTSRIVRDSTKHKKFRDDVAFQLENVKPVIQLVKDSIESAQAAKEISQWKTKYEIDHQWRVEKEAKERGKIVMLIPDWIPWLLFVLAGLAALAWWKGFNPLSLLRRKKSTT